MVAGRTWAYVPLVMLLVAGAVTGCGGGSAPTPTAPTASEVTAFLDDVNTTLERRWIEMSQAGWVAQTYINADTEALDARATLAAIEAIAGYAKAATRFDDVEVTPEQRRQLDVLKLSLVMATPSNPAEAGELTTINSRTPCS